MGIFQNQNNYPQPYGYERQSSPMRRWLILGGTLFVLPFLVMAIVLALTAKPNLRPDYVRAAAATQEVIRLSEIGLSNSQSSRDSLVLASNAKAVASHTLLRIQTLIDLDYEKSITKDELASAESVEATDELEVASSTNTFDDRFQEILPLAIAAANEHIKTVFTKTDNPDYQALLNEIYEDNLLVSGQTTN